MTSLQEGVDFFDGHRSQTPGIGRVANADPLLGTTREHSVPGGGSFVAPSNQHPEEVHEIQRLAIPPQTRVSPTALQAGSSAAIVFEIEPGEIEEIHTIELEMAITSSAVGSTGPIQTWFRVEEKSNGGQKQTSFDDNYWRAIKDQISTRPEQKESLARITLDTGTMGDYTWAAETKTVIFKYVGGLATQRGPGAIRPNHMTGRYQIIFHVPSTGIGGSTNTALFTVNPDTVFLHVSGHHRPGHAVSRREAALTSQPHITHYEQAVNWNETHTLAAGVELKLRPQLDLRVSEIMIRVSGGAVNDPNSPSEFGDAEALGDDFEFDIKDRGDKSLLGVPRTVAYQNKMLNSQAFADPYLVSTYSATTGTVSPANVLVIPLGGNPTQSWQTGSQHAGVIEWTRWMEISLKPPAGWTTLPYRVDVWFTALHEVTLSPSGDYSSKTIVQDY